MANGTKRAEFPRPSGPMVEFYLPPNDQYKKGHVLPYSINGYEGQAVVGARNKAPKDVVTMLQQCMSRTKVPDLKSVDPSQRGVPRAQEDFFNPKPDYVYQQDFDIEILKEE